MRVLLLGTMVPKETQDYCYNMGQRIIPAEIVQNYTLHGLEELKEVEYIDSIGAVRIQSWPKSKIIRIDNAKEKLSRGISIGVGFINLPLIAFPLRENGLVNAAKKWANSHKNEHELVVLIHSMHSPFLHAANEIKKINPKVKVILTVPDLPLFMDMRGSIRRLLKKIDWKRITKLRKCVDKYLLYTKYMAEYLDIPPDRWMLFEGIIDEKKIVNRKQEKASERFALYAGNLDARYGIDTLIEAFSTLSEDQKLYIYGAGFDSERITAIAKSLKNVEYLGQVSSDEIFEIMKKATILVNPRPTTIGLAKYSCPSKTFEYMASGTPIIMNKLSGLPDEYLKYVYLFSEENAEAYARDLQMLFQKSDDELSDFGLRGARFLLENKTSKSIMKRVCDFAKE